MECFNDEFCCGCLSRDRKMKLLSTYWSNEDFYKIITEISLEPQTSISVHICWECERHIFNFIKFKHKAKASWKTLQDFIKEPLKPHPKTASNLTLSTLKIHDITQTFIDENYITDTNPDLPMNYEVKVESYSDDDRTLLDLISEKKSLENSKEFALSTENSFDTLLQDEKKVLCNDDKVFVNNKKVCSKNVKVEHTKKLEFELDGDMLLKNKDLSQKEIKKLRKKDKKRKLKKQVVDNINKSMTDEETFLEFEKIELTTEEILKERLEMASKEEFADSMFKCEACILPFANEEDLKEHTQKKHSFLSKHKCRFCERCFPSAATLESHVCRHTARWRCTVCGHLSASAVAALAHYRRAHAQPTGEMHDLAAKAYGSYEVKSPENSEVVPKSTEQIPCKHCPKTFRWRTSLRKHMESHNIESGQKRRPRCEPCNLTFSSSANLKKHMQCSSKHQIKLKLRKLKEDSQNQDLTEIPDIENITSSIISQKEQFPCPQCDKKFQWKGNLWRHLQSHAARANGALVCEPCNRVFSSIATYKQHMEISRKHVTESEYKYMCSDCGKRFYNKIKLRDHIDWEHLKKYTHICSVCQKVFKSHTSLYLHRQVVHKLSNAHHLCDHCGKSFPNKTKLRSHVSALHTKETPYKCTSCSARFSWHSCLSRHMKRVHRARNTNGNTATT